MPSVVTNNIDSELVDRIQSVTRFTRYMSVSESIKSVVVI